MKFSHPEMGTHETLVGMYADLSEEGFHQQIQRDQSELAKAFQDGDVRRVHMCQVKHWAAINHLQGTDDPRPV